MNTPSTWYSIRRRTAVAAAALGVAAAAEVYIYGDIGESWYEETVSAAAFVRDLQALDVDAITVRINSMGGSVPDGFAIYNAIRRHKATVTTEVDGIAYSIASLIAMAGDKVHMADNAVLMIHAPWTYGAGNSVALRELADTLDTWAVAMSTSYAARTGDQPGMLALLTDGKDHYFTAAEALAANFIDSVTDPMPIAASAARELPTGRYLPKHAADAQHTTFQPRTIDMPSPATPSAAEIAASTLQADAQRRAGIQATFSRFASNPVYAALQRQCEGDHSVTVEAAGQRLLARMAEGVEPVAGHFVQTFAQPSGATTQMAEFRAAATDALMIRAGIRVSKPHPAAADLRRTSIVGMAERVLSMQGKYSRDMSRDQTIRAAMSTSDFPALLAGVTSTSLRAGYLAAPATHALWTSEREVPDFKPRTLAMLSEGPALELIPEGAEYKYGAYSESASTFVVKTYGKIVKFTRQALINDELDALTSIPVTQGAAARRLEADMVYAQLTGNPTLGDGVALFHATHGNLMTGAALSVASLGTARAAMRTQKGIGGKEFIDPQPRYLIVPVAMETQAEQLLASTVDPSKTNNTENAEWVRNLTLVADPRLDANSTAAWYLASAPSQVEGIVRAYLEGEARPFLDSSDGWKTDTTEWKVRLDFGVGVVDYRALVKNPGA